MHHQDTERPSGANHQGMTDKNKRAAHRRTLPATPPVLCRSEHFLPSLLRLRWQICVQTLIPPIMHLQMPPEWFGHARRHRSAHTKLIRWPLAPCRGGATSRLTDDDARPVWLAAVAGCRPLHAVHVFLCASCGSGAVVGEKGSTTDKRRTRDRDPPTTAQRRSFVLYIRHTCLCSQPPLTLLPPATRTAMHRRSTRGKRAKAALPLYVID